MVGCFNTDSGAKSRVHGGRAGFKGIGLFRTREKSEFNKVTSEHPFILRILVCEGFERVSPAMRRNRIRECREKIYLSNEFDSVIGYLDLTLFVKAADCLFEDFFTHFEFLFNIVR